MPEIVPCELVVTDLDVTVEGSPEDLRKLASALERDGRAALRDGGSVEIDYLADPAPFRARTVGRALKVDGSRSNVEAQFIGELRQVADAEDAHRDEPIARHAHVEYLGEGDRWRAPDSLPLVIQAAR